MHSEAGPAAAAGDPGRPASARASGVPVLGLDVGSTNVKAVLVALHPALGTVAEVAVRAVATPADPDALVRAVHGLVASVLAGRPAPRAVGVASMAETGAVLGPDGRPLTELLRWDGHRGAADADLLAAELGRDELFGATGVRPSAKAPLATWRWLRRTRPGVWGRDARWAGAADLVVLALTGRLVTDHTLAGRTMAYRLPVAGEPLPDGFDPDLLAAVGLHADQLPVVARPGDPAGVVSGPAFVRSGLPAGTPVVVAGHDHAVGAWAAGVREPGDRGDSIGTAEAVVTVLGSAVDGAAVDGAAVDGAAADRAAVAAEGMSLVRTVAGTHEAVLAGSPAAGAMVAWWLRTVLPGRRPDDVLAGPVPDTPTGILVLPYPGGRQAPAPDPSARVRVVDRRGVDLTATALRPVPGTGVPPSAATLTVAMVEGLALQARWMLDVQRGLAHGGAAPAPGAGPIADAPPLHVLAGAAGANRLWMGLKAVVTPAPVQVVAALEPVATGAALLAAERVGLVAAGVLRLAARAVARPPVAVSGYEAALERFVAAATGRPVPAIAPVPPTTTGAR